MSPSSRPPSPPRIEPSSRPPRASARHGGDDAVGQPAERKRLQPDPAGAAQRGEEQSFAAEQRRLDLADVLNVVVDRRLKRDDAAGVDANRLSPAASVRSCSVPPAWTNAHPSPCRRCMMKPFAAEQSDAELALKRDADAHAFGRGEKRVLLRDQLAAELGQVDRR